MMRLILTLPLLALFQCDKDETVAAYGAAERVWALQEIDGRPYEASALLQFPKKARLPETPPATAIRERLARRILGSRLPT